MDRYDSFGNSILWAYNGLSNGGTFTWEKVELDILKYAPSAYRSEVRIRFNCTQYMDGTGYGYYLDDVEVIIRSGSLDYWGLTTFDAYSGAYSWWNTDLNAHANGMLPEGVDNSLMTAPIDLTNAKEAQLEAMFKFNINDGGGFPPDGFRVEVTSDNGESWVPINFGARTAWGVSGSDPTLPKSYTGYDEGDNWVSSDTLLRLNADLTGWIGRQIRVRFMVVTTLENSYSPGSGLYCHRDHPYPIGFCREAHYA